MYAYHSSNAMHPLYFRRGPASHGNLVIYNRNMFLFYMVENFSLR